MQIAHPFYSYPIVSMSLLRPASTPTASLALIASLLTAPAIAQVPIATTTIVFSPTAAGGASVASIPTLSQWGLIAVSVMTAFFAYRAIRHGAAGRILSVSAFGAAVAVAASQVAPPAFAVPGHALENPQGGTVVLTGRGEFMLPNTSGAAQTIRSVTVDNATREVPQGAPECTAGLVVAAGSTCYVRVEVLL